MSFTFCFVYDIVQRVYGTATNLCVINMDFDTGMLFCCFFAMDLISEFKKLGGTEVLWSSLSFGPSSLIIFNAVFVIVILI